MTVWYESTHTQAFFFEINVSPHGEAFSKECFNEISFLLQERYLGVLFYIPDIFCPYNRIPTERRFP
jgi:hypothetical protein